MRCEAGDCKQAVPDRRSLFFGERAEPHEDAPAKVDVSRFAALPKPGRGNRGHPAAYRSLPVRPGIDCVARRIASSDCPS